MKLSLKFLGGAGTVTGSKHLLQIGSHRILVDCGLFQGVKEQRLLNWSPLKVDAKSIDAVVLTHAHLDHVGYLPLLKKQGFSGPIYCSEPTLELTKLVLMDSGKIQAEDAEFANKGGYSKHSPALPLYTTGDVEAVLPHLHALPIDKPIPLFNGGSTLKLSNSGHILGSTFVEIEAAGKRIVFSGDLGRSVPLTLNSRAHLKSADVLVLECTYGDRCHPNEDLTQILTSVINRAVRLGGHVLIPAFAIGRTQDILHLIALLKDRKLIPDIPVYLDSPMALKATQIFENFPKWHSLSTPDLKRIMDTFEAVTSPAHSRLICDSKDPAIVIAGSGMLTGGRMKHHLFTRIAHPENTVLLIGYQAAGTLGRFLKEGAREAKLFGRYLPVNAEIRELSGFSAHADQHEILEWLAEFRRFPEKIFLVHGEANAAEGLRVRITDRFGLIPGIAKMNEEVDL